MKDIKGYEKLYAVTENGEVWSYKSKKFLKSADNGKGYKYVHLRKNGLGKNYLVHRLVAETFIENPLMLSEINHKNENKSDNSIDNLEWCSHSYNNLYQDKGKRSAKTRLKNDKIYRKVKCIETNTIYNSIKDAADTLNIFSGDISRACRNVKGRKTCGGYHWQYV